MSPKGRQASEFPADHTRVWVQTGLAGSHKAKATLYAVGPSPHTLPLCQSWQLLTVSPGKLTPESSRVLGAAGCSQGEPGPAKAKQALASSEHRAAGGREAQTLPLTRPAALASGHSACCWTGARRRSQGDPARSCAAIWGPGEEPLLTRVKTYGHPHHSALQAPRAPMQPFPNLILQILKSYLGTNPSLASSATPYTPSPRVFHAPIKFKLLIARASLPSPLDLLVSVSHSSLQTDRPTGRQADRQAHTHTHTTSAACTRPQPPSITQDSAPTL